MPGRPANSENVTPEQSMLPAPELTNDPVIVEAEDQGGAGSQQKSNMVSLADFDLIKVIGYSPNSSNSLNSSNASNSSNSPWLTST